MTPVDNCSHPPERQWAWFVHDPFDARLEGYRPAERGSCTHQISDGEDYLCHTCCECGAIINGAVDIQGNRVGPQWRYPRTKAKRKRKKKEEPTP